MTLEERHKFLSQVVKILDEAGIEFWLDCGTLLGVIRGDDFIEWDHDIDISTKKENQPYVQLLVNKFRAIGEFGECKRNNQFISSDYVVKDGYKIDIYYWYGVGDYYICYTNDEYTNIAPKHYFQPLKEIDFKGLKVKIPNNPEKFLEERFGKNWRIPDKNWQENNQKTLKPLKDYIKYFV